MHGCTCVSKSWSTTPYPACGWKFIPKTPVRKVAGKKMVAISDSVIAALLDVMDEREST